MAVTFVRNDPGDYDIKLGPETVGAILRDQDRFGTQWVVRLPFPLGPTVASTLSEAQSEATRLLEEGQRIQRAKDRFEAERLAPQSPPQETPMTEPSADPRVAAPTPEETRWASFVMNEQRHGREVSPADRTQAGEIMRRARHASGRTGGGSKAKPKASPLVVAKAIKDIDAKVAEAQGINASREGDPVPPPPEAPERLVPQVVERPQVPRVPTQADHDRRLEAIVAPERDFREASARLLEQIDADLKRFRQARDNAAKLILDYDARLDRLQRRHEAILDGLRALDEGEGEEAPHA